MAFGGRAFQVRVLDAQHELPAKADARKSWSNDPESYACSVDAIDSPCAPRSSR